MIFPKVSVVICCHNSALRILPTLRHLAGQKNADAFDWEVVVINNASTDGTRLVVEQECPPELRERLRVIDEPVAGLSSARIRGVAEARYDIVSFVDDDNWVCPGWIPRIVGIFQDPTIGVAGGPAEAACEVTPPDWFPAIQGFYATGEPHASTGEVTDASGTLLWGAGLTLRKEAWTDLLNKGFKFLLTGRKGGRLMAGEDTELCFALRAAGWRFWYDKELCLKHAIPAERLNWNYARKLMNGMGAAATVFNLYLIGLKRHPFHNVPSYKKLWSFRFLRALFHFLRIRIFHPIETFQKSEGLRCVLEMEFSSGELASLLVWRAQFRKLIGDIENSRWNALRPGQDR